MTKLCFVDCETTGLDPQVHEIWELAIIERETVQADDAGGERITRRAEHVWTLDVERLPMAMPDALRVGRYYERHEAGLGVARAHEAMAPAGIAVDVAQMTAGAHLVGAVPSFDAAFLQTWLAGAGLVHAWHYHLIDVEALAAGWLARHPLGPGSVARPPWDSGELSRAVGVDPDEFDRHTAVGDARWAEAIYDAVMGGSTDGHA